jgi:thioredoxin 1
MDASKALKAGSFALDAVVGEGCGMAIRVVDEGDGSDSKTPVMLEFYADWCAPCQEVSPALEELAHEFQGRIRLVRVNVDADSELVDKYAVYSIPTIVMVRNGREANRIIGAKGKDQYRAAIIETLKG